MPFMDTERENFEVFVLIACIIVKLVQLEDGLVKSRKCSFQLNCTCFLIIYTTVCVILRSVKVKFHPTTGHEGPELE